MKKLILPNGSSKYGAQMGRRNILPLDVNAFSKLQMEKLRWVDFDYDQFGCYWGNSGDNIFCAHGGTELQPIFVFVRATNRPYAKELVKDILPNARFFN